MISRDFCLRLVGMIFCLLLVGCAYHGRVPRGIYHPTAQPNRADQSILVVSDKNIPQKILITDPTSSALYDFTLEVGDGTAVAVTDALSAFVARADAGAQRLENQYDLIADVKLEAGLTRADCAASMPNLAARQNGLCTMLTLTVRPSGSPHALGSFSARRWSAFEKPGAAATVRWLNKSTVYLLSPVLLPTYTQLQGAQLRRQFQTHLKEILDDISAQLQDHPNIFQPSSVSTD